MDRRQTVPVIILTVLWCISMLLAPPNSYSETPLDQIKAELSSRQLDTRIAAVEKLRPRRDEETVDLLIAVVDNRREAWEVQVKAIQLLGEAKNPRALNLLLHIFNSHSKDWECPAIKSYTASALGNFGGEPGVFDALVKGLHDPELLTREASVKALGIIRDEKALPFLIPLLQNKSIAIRLSVIKAIENIGNSRAIPALEIIVEDDSDKVVRQIAKVAISNLNKN